MRRSVCRLGEDGMAGRRVDSVDILDVDGDQRFIVCFVLDGGKGSEQELTTEGKNGGAPARDAALDQESGELGHEIVYFDGGFELGDLVAEGGTEICGVGLVVLEGDVTKAKSGAGVQGV